MQSLKSLIALLSLIALAGIAQADEYGCKVLMCMSNPKGPMAENECRPPIQKFLQGQAKKPKDPHPTCEEAQNTSMQSAMRPYDQCPQGTSALGQDSEAMQIAADTYVQLLMNVKRVPGSPWLTGVLNMPSDVQVLTGIGEGGQNSGGKNKVCVGNKLGPITFKTGPDEEPTMKTVTVYDQVTTIAPAASPRVMDIYVDQKLFKSVRY